VSDLRLHLHPLSRIVPHENMAFSQLFWTVRLRSVKQLGLKIKKLDAVKERQSMQTASEVGRVKSTSDYAASSQAPQAESDVEEIVAEVIDPIPHARTPILLHC